MTDKEFIKIVSNFDGNIIKQPDKIYIESINEICCYFVDGRIAEKKKVICRIGIQYHNWGCTLFGEEKTFSILGGFSTPNFDKQIIFAQLKRYNFKEKTTEQLDIFSLL